MQHDARVLVADLDLLAADAATLSKAEAKSSRSWPTSRPMARPP